MWSYDKVDIKVNQREALELLDLFYNEPTHCDAWRVKDRALFSRKLTVQTIGDNGIIEKPDQNVMDTFMQTYYTPTMRTALPQLYALGYVVYTMVKQESPRFGNKPIYTPSLIPREYYDLVCRYWYKDGRTQWFVCPKNRILEGVDDNGDPNFHIFFVEGCMPHIPSGKHNSIATPTRIQSKYVAQMYENNMRADTQRAHPPVTIEQQVQGGQSVPLAPFASPGLLEYEGTKSQEKVVAAIAESTMITSLQYQIGAKREADDMVTSTASESTVKKFKSSFEDNLQYVPTGWKLGTQPQLPEGQKELPAYVAAKDEHILCQHGVPPSLVLSGARNSSKTSTNQIDEGDFTQFQRTLTIEMNMLCNFGTEMYLSTFPELNGKSDLLFKLPIIPYTTPSAVQRMYDQAAIHNEARVGMLLALNGMSEDDRLLEEEEITRPPLQGNENQTTAVMKAKVRVMNAEALEKEANAHARKSEIESSKNEAEAQIKLMEMQMELEKFKLKAQLEILQKKLEVDREKITLQAQQVKKKKKKASEAA